MLANALTTHRGLIPASSSTRRKTTGRGLVLEELEGEEVEG
jgi:hypothetical protein